MSVRFEATIPVPEETAQVARAAFPKGNRYLAMRDVLGPIYSVPSTMIRVLPRSSRRRDGQRKRRGVWR